MKFLANENIPLVSVQLLNESGYDTISVRDLMPGAKDREVLAEAQRQSRIILTFDKDYGEMVFKYGLRGNAGVVMFRFFPESPGHAAHLLTGIIHQGIDLHGRFTIIDGKKIRQRILRK